MKSPILKAAGTVLLATGSRAARYATRQCALFASECLIVPADGFTDDLDTRYPGYRYVELNDFFFNDMFDE